MPADPTTSATLTGADFRRRFYTLILLAWTVPPIFGLSFLLYIQIFSLEQMGIILTTPLEPIFVTAALVFALFYFSRFSTSISRHLEHPTDKTARDCLQTMRRFSTHFWGLFLLYLLLAPGSTILSAELYTDYQATPVDWFRIHLVALIVSIIVGLPIYFRTLDLFGQCLGDIRLQRPQITLKAKVFMIGALMPLLVDTMIVQYYWTRTGFFSSETFIIWLTLELLAIASSLIFTRSLDQSLAPLQGIIGAPSRLTDIDINTLKPRSTDEIGVLTTAYHQLLSNTQAHNAILRLNNRLLAEEDQGVSIDDVAKAIIDMCTQVFAADIAYIMLHDDLRNELVGVIQSGNRYKPDGHYRLSLNTTALSVWAFKQRHTLAIDDVHSDPRVSPEMCERFDAISAMATPMMLGGKAIGILMVSNSEHRHHYTADDITLIEDFARETALTVHTQRLKEKRLQAEASSREQASRVRLLLDSTVGAIYGADLNGVCTFVNRACLEMLGYEHENELLGHNMHELIHHTSPNGNPCPGEECVVRLATMEGVIGHADNEVLWRTDGTSFPVEFWSHPVFENNHLIGNVATFIDISKRKQDEAELNQFKATLDQTIDCVFMFEPMAMKFIYANAGAMHQVGYSQDELLQMTPIDIKPDYNEQQFRDMLQPLIDGSSSKAHFETTHQHKDGHLIPVDILMQYISAPEDQPHFVAIVRDITERRQADEEFQQLHTRNQLLLESTGEGIIGVDLELKCSFSNQAAAGLLGYTADKLQGYNFHQVIQPRYEDGRNMPREENLVLSAITKDLSLSSDAEVFWHRDGHPIPVQLQASPIHENGTITGAVVVFHDIAESRAMAQRMDYLATHDALTGLLNRYEFERHLQRALENASVLQIEHILCYLDLDQFKVVNDTCGHVAGDELLRQLTTLLSKKVRHSDALARLGGDEFGVLLDSCPLDKALELIEELRHTVEDFRFVWEGKSFTIGVSIGVVPINADTESLTHALSAADSACYVAKERGRNRIHVYEATDEDLSQRHGEMQWVSRIHGALSQNRFQLRFQSIAPTNQPQDLHHFFEVLLIMCGEDGQQIPPGAFIPAAERYNLMPAIDRWVIHETFTWLHDNRERLTQVAHCSINLSGHSINQDDFLGFIHEQMDAHDINPGQICFEITETAAVANLSRASEFINELRSEGCRFALDDFGSGMSSFAYLKNLPVDFLKIDGNFVRDMANDPIDRAMVEAIHQVGHVMGLKTIAEFVEDEAILQHLQRIGIDYVQGYGIAKPRLIEEFTLPTD